MGIQVRNWVTGCATCQQMKVNTHPTVPGITPIKSNATTPFEQVSLDFITNLPESKGFDSIMVVVDHGLTKGVVYTPCNKTIDALGTTQLYINSVWRHYGFPSTMISDRGPQFASQVFQEMMKTFKVNHRMYGLSPSNRQRNQKG